MAKILCTSGEIASRPNEFKCFRDKEIPQYWFTKAMLLKITGNKEEASIEMEAAVTKDEYEEVKESMLDAKARPAPKRRPTGKKSKEPDTPEVKALKEAIAKKKASAASLFTTLRNEAAVALGLIPSIVGDGTESLHIGIAAKSLGGTFKVHAEARGITNTEMEALIAMKVRVMCSHDRSRNAPEVKLEKDDQPRNKVPRHPFLNFRTPDSDEEDAEHEALLIAREFDGRQAVEHYSDGSCVPATAYKHGQHGMVVASWVSGACLELEVPDSCLGADGAVTIGPIRPIRKKPARMMKKPAGPTMKTPEEGAGSLC